MRSVKCGLHRPQSTIRLCCHRDRSITSLYCRLPNRNNTISPCNGTLSTCASPTFAPAFDFSFSDHHHHQRRFFRQQHMSEASESSLRTSDAEAIDSSHCHKAILDVFVAYFRNGNDVGREVAAGATIDDKVPVVDVSTFGALKLSDLSRRLPDDVLEALSEGCVGGLRGFLEEHSTIYQLSTNNEPAEQRKRGGGGALFCGMIRRWNSSSRERGDALQQEQQNRDPVGHSSTKKPMRPSRATILRGNTASVVSRIHVGNLPAVPPPPPSALTASKPLGSAIIINPRVTPYMLSIEQHRQSFVTGTHFRTVFLSDLTMHFDWGGALPKNRTIALTSSSSSSSLRQGEDDLEKNETLGMAAQENPRKERSSQRLSLSSLRAGDNNNNHALDCGSRDNDDRAATSESEELWWIGYGPSASAFPNPELTIPDNTFVKHLLRVMRDKDDSTTASSSMAGIGGGGRSSPSGRPSSAEEDIRISKAYIRALFDSSCAPIGPIDEMVEACYANGEEVANALSFPNPLYYFVPPVRRAYGLHRHRPQAIETAEHKSEECSRFFRSVSPSDPYDSFSPPIPILNNANKEDCTTMLIPNEKTFLTHLAQHFSFFLANVVGKLWDKTISDPSKLTLDDFTRLRRLDWRAPSAGNSEEQQEVETFGECLKHFLSFDSRVAAGNTCVANTGDTNKITVGLGNLGGGRIGTQDFEHFRTRVFEFVAIPNNFAVNDGNGEGSHYRRVLWTNGGAVPIYRNEQLSKILFGESNYSCGEAPNDDGDTSDRVEVDARGVSSFLDSHTFYAMIRPEFHNAIAPLMKQEGIGTVVDCMAAKLSVKSDASSVPSRHSTESEKSRSDLAGRATLTPPVVEDYDVFRVARFVTASMEHFTPIEDLLVNSGAREATRCDLLHVILSAPHLFELESIRREENSSMTAASSPFVTGVRYRVDPLFVPTGALLATMHLTIPEMEMVLNLSAQKRNRQDQKKRAQYRTYARLIQRAVAIRKAGCELLPCADPRVFAHLLYDCLPERPIASDQVLRDVFSSDERLSFMVSQITESDTRIIRLFPSLFHMWESGRGSSWYILRADMPMPKEAIQQKTDLSEEDLLTVVRCTVEGCIARQSSSAMLEAFEVFRKHGGCGDDDDDDDDGINNVQNFAHVGTVARSIPYFITSSPLLRKYGGLAKYLMAMPQYFRVLSKTKVSERGQEIGNVQLVSLVQKKVQYCK